jgi:hypothetical protein
MSRKNIILFIIAGIIAIALIAGGFAYKYFTSFHTVTISIKNPEITVDVYQPEEGINPEDGTPNDKKISSVKGVQKLSLQAGNYYVVPQGEKFDTSQITFQVADKDISVNVNPGLSATYLSLLLKQELPRINSVIIAKYPIATTNFALNNGKLYKDGTWYGTTLIQHATAGNNGDVYRTILHKVNGVWQFAATPELVLTVPMHKDIPQSVLSDINDQTGYQN